MPKVKINDEILCKNCKAIVDTGTSFLSLPTKDFKAIVKSIGLYYDESIPIYQVNCEAREIAPDIVFNFGDRDFHLSPRSYIIKIRDNSQPSGWSCLIAIEGHNNPLLDFWLLGDTFIRQYYIEFDMGNRTVSIADLNHKNLPLN